MNEHAAFIAMAHIGKRRWHDRRPRARPRPPFHLKQIANVDGVDGVFLGPADLSASMGLLGKAGAEPVRAAIRDGIAIVRNTGKAAGVLAPDERFAREYLAAGATFVAVGTDVSLLNSAAQSLLSTYSSARADDVEKEKSGY